MRCFLVNPCRIRSFNPHRLGQNATNGSTWAVDAEQRGKRRGDIDRRHETVISPWHKGRTEKLQWDMSVITVRREMSCA